MMQLPAHLDDDYLTAATWGARTVGQKSQMKYLPAKYIVLHHTVTNATSNPVADAITVEGIGVSRFGRLSYSWLFHPLGTTLEGQGLHRGAHTVDEKGAGPGGATIYGMNDRGFSFSGIGDFTKTKPTNAMIDAMARLIVRLLQAGHLDPDFEIRVHYEFKATLCPGSLAEVIPAILDRVETIQNPKQAEADVTIEPPPIPNARPSAIQKRKTTRALERAARARRIAEESRALAVSNRKRIETLEDRIEQADDEGHNFALVATALSRRVDVLENTPAVASRQLVDLLVEALDAS